MLNGSIQCGRIGGLAVTRTTAQFAGHARKCVQLLSRRCQKEQEEKSDVNPLVVGSGPASDRTLTSAGLGLRAAGIRLRTDGIGLPGDGLGLRAVDTGLRGDGLG